MGWGVAPRGFYTFHLHHVLIFTLEVCQEFFTYNGLVKSLHDMWRCLIRHKWTSTCLGCLYGGSFPQSQTDRGLSKVWLLHAPISSHTYCFDTVRCHFPFQCTTFPLFFYVHAWDRHVWLLLSRLAHEFCVFKTACEVKRFSTVISNRFEHSYSGCVQIHGFIHHFLFL